MTLRNENSSGENSSFLPKKTNLRLLTVNCCRIHQHKSEFTAALDYVKPDLICGTESWLKGVKPGKEPAKNTIKTSEIFPSVFIIHRNDRMSRGGGVFTGVRKSLIADEQKKSPKCERTFSVWSNFIYYSWHKVINNGAYQIAQMRSLVWVFLEMLYEVNLDSINFALSE